jgi:arylsulfatase A-like enzyme
MVRPQAPHLLNLHPPAYLAEGGQARQLELLRQFNEDHLREHAGDSDLDARMQTYELAARMQTAAQEAFDLSGEPASVRKMYGLDDDATRDYATRCLIARRLVERGVRFVQVLNQGQSWDHHGSIRAALPDRCREVDRPCAALVKDLKQRGLLDSTIVHWGGEMGRLPVLQNDGGPDKWGRDHNTHGFSCWMAGGGFRGGYVHGETDEWGHRAIRDVVNHYDWHATLLHLFGLSHERLVFKRNAREATLTDGQPAKVISELLA